jgi:predicted dehydrogenase
MNPTRRKVLTSTAALVAGAMIHKSAGAQTRPATTAAAKPATTKAATTQANSKPNLALIGCGGIGRWHAGYLGRHVNLVALADVDRSRLDALNNEFAGGKAFLTGDYREVLARSDIDLVMICSPDHWHTKMTADAMRAGKDVYCEKPLTLTIDEHRLLCRVTRETSRVLQVGSQQRSEDQFNTAIALARSGRLGKIRHVTVIIGPTDPADPASFIETNPPAELDWDTWLGQAPKVPYMKRRCHFDFRWWYDYSGGRMTDWGAHHVDTAMAAVVPDLPGPMSIEPVNVRFPVPFDMHGQPLSDAYFNTATRFEVTCRFANGVEMLIADRVDRFPADNGIMILGDAGALFVNREKIFGPAVDALKENPLPPGALTLNPPGSSPIPHEIHFVNFLDCVKSRRLPNSDVFENFRTLTTCHLANIAMRLGRTIHWDASAQHIVGDDEADAFQVRQQRKGFEVG